MKLPNRITTTAEAPPGEYQRSLYLSLLLPEFKSARFRPAGSATASGAQSVRGGSIKTNTGIPKTIFRSQYFETYNKGNFIYVIYFVYFIYFIYFMYSI